MSTAHIENYICQPHVHVYILSFVAFSQSGKDPCRVYPFGSPIPPSRCACPPKVSFQSAYKSTGGVARDVYVDMYVCITSTNQCKHVLLNVKTKRPSTAIFFSSSTSTHTFIYVPCISEIRLISRIFIVHLI